MLFADDLVLLASRKVDLQHSLDRFETACDLAVMKISTSKTEVLCISRQPMTCNLTVSGEHLKQMEKFKYLGIAFTSDGKQDNELDTRIGKAGAVLRELQRSVVQAKLAIFNSVYVPILYLWS